MDTKKHRQHRRDDARLTESRNARSEQLDTRGAYRVTNQRSLACLSGSEHLRPGWFLDMKYQTCPYGVDSTCTCALTSSYLASVVPYSVLPLQGKWLCRPVDQVISLARDKHAKVMLSIWCWQEKCNGLNC